MTPERPEALRVALEVIGLLDRLGIRYRPHSTSIISSDGQDIWA